MYTDPSYLRSIRDGILSGSIEVNNSNALPDGLAGVFDRELFPSTLALRERRELLLFFIPFALAQKELSVDFAADILTETWMKYPAEGEANYQSVYDQVNKFTQLHSKRFVSAGEGKYRLYHERFRAYILQKATELDLRTFNDQIISLSEKALEEKSGNEKEIYALEFLSTHLYINAIQEKEQVVKLKSLAYSQTYWERQNHSSKSFEWSKKMLNEMMAWASKFDDEEVIECALQKVDLYYQEQNDAPRIVQLVADGDIETALIRIESFGGDDKEGLKRKFTLYMLCLMELTLLESKNKPFRKEGIEMLLNHLDENLPVDHSQLNWNDFFPSYSVFLMACEWEELGLDYLKVFKRTGRWNNSWINRNGPYSENQIRILANFALDLDMILLVYSELIKQNDEYKGKEFIEHAKTIANNEDTVYGQYTSYYKIATILSKNGKLDDSFEIIRQKPMLNLSESGQIKYLYEGKEFILTLKALGQNGALMYAVEQIKYVRDKQDKCYLIYNLLYQLEKENKISLFEVLNNELKQITDLYVNDAINESKDIKDGIIRHDIFSSVVKLLMCQDRLTDAIEYVNELLPSQQSYYLKDIAIRILHSNIEDSLRISLSIKDKTNKIKALINISTHLFSNKEFAKSVLINAEVSYMIENMSNSLSKDESLEQFAYHLLLQGNISSSRHYYLEIMDDEIRTKSFITLSFIFLEKKMVFEFVQLILTTLSLSNKLKGSNRLSSTDQDIINTVIKFDQNYSTSKILECLYLGYDILGLYERLALKYASENNFSDCLYVINKISLIKNKSIIFAITSSIFFFNDQITYSNKLMKLSKLHVSKIKNKWIQDKAYSRISIEYFKQSNYEECCLTLTKISQDHWNNETIELIIYDAVLLGKLFEIISYFEQYSIYYQIENIKQIMEIQYTLLRKKIIFKSDKDNCPQSFKEFYLKICKNLLEVDEIILSKKFASNQKDQELKDSCFKEISIYLAKHGNFSQSLKDINLIKSTYDRIEAMCSISHYQFLSNKFHDAELMLINSLLIARNINPQDNEFDKLFNNLQKLNNNNHSASLSFIEKSPLFFSELKDKILRVISLEYIKQEKLKQAEIICINIGNIKYRRASWISIGQILFNLLGYKKSIKVLKKFINIEANYYVRKGILESISFDKINKKMAIDILKNNNFKINEKELISEKYILNQIFFSNLSQEKLNRYNRTLNIQWAIDIKNQLPS